MLGGNWAVQGENSMEAPSSFFIIIHVHERVGPQHEDALGLHPVYVHFSPTCTYTMMRSAFIFN